MKPFKIFIVKLLLCGSLPLSALSANQGEALFKNSDEVKIQFTPPEGWRMADKKDLPKHVLALVIGKGKEDFPPSMNLGYDPFSGSMKDYLKVIKEINLSQGCILKDLGTISTGAGDASLSQFDEKTEWGEVRQMHAILIHEGVAYILTASALKEEFPKFYQQFFKAMQSLRIDAGTPSWSQISLRSQ